jgi:DNA-binding MarR family transcriptional regulator
LPRTELKINVPDFTKIKIDKSERVLEFLAKNLVELGFSASDPAYHILLQITARQGSRPVVFVSLNELSTQCQISLRTAQRAIDRLKEARYIEVRFQERTYTGVANSYSVEPLRQSLGLVEEV